MKRLVLLTTAITSISDGIAAGRITNNEITVYAEDLVNDRYKEYSCRGGELLKRYYQAKEFTKYMRTEWCEAKVEENPNGENVLMLQQMYHAGGKDNYPENQTNVKMIAPGIIDEKQTMFGPQFAQRLNIRNLSLDIISKEVFHNGRSYKVILPPDCSKMFQNEEYFNKSSIRSIDLSGATGKLVKTTSQMFRDQNSLISLNLRTFDTSNVNDMSGMFESCKNLISLNLSSFNTSNVQTMARMFFGCRNLTSLNLSNFNTANVIDMWRMFKDCGSLTSLNLSSFNTANVATMDEMFESCENLKSLDLSSFDTKNVKTMAYMFANCRKIKSLNLERFNTRNVICMQYMFSDCTTLAYLDLRNFDTSYVEDMQRMFSGCRDLSSIRFSNKYPFITSVDMTEMFSNCVSLSDLQLPELEVKIELPKLIKLKNGFESKQRFELKKVIKIMRKCKKADDIFENCISLSHVPDGNKIPIIKQDLSGEINMIEQTIYPQKRPQKPQKVSSGTTK